MTLDWIHSINFICVCRRCSLSGELNMHIFSIFQGRDVRILVENIQKPKIVLLL